MPKPVVGLATAAAVPDLDEEGRQLVRAIAATGMDAMPAVWDDPGVDWSGFDLVVVRSTWDYATRRAEFVAWAERVAALTRLLNPPSLLAWTTDKRYLADLEAAGVPVVPSFFLRPGSPPDHPYLAGEHVVKPAVSAGSRDTLRLGPEEAERSLAHVRVLLGAGRDVLVQPYVDGVDTAGETALVFVDGGFSHATRKGPILRRGDGLVEGLFAEEELRPMTAGPAELATGRTALAAVPGADAPLYARVDLLPGPDGPRVLEVELAEPSLFLTQHDGAAARFAAAIRRRVPG